MTCYNRGMCTSDTWLPIPSEPGYEASAEGEVRSLPKRVFNSRGYYTKPSRVLIGSIDQKGYRRVCINGHTRLLHQLVYEAFHGPRRKGGQVRHLDGNRRNNRPDNLGYGSNSDNQQDSIRHGTQKCVKLTHCKYGHEFTPENTYIRRTTSGGTGRACRKCRANRSRKYQAKRKAQKIAK